jgi:dihydroneopterin aldolase
MTTPLITWTIKIEDVGTWSRVGIWEHELELQPLRISLSVQAIAPAFPRRIEDCLDYQPICRWITDDWPRMPHTPLVETRLRELMDFVFHYDPRIEWVDASVLKPTAVAQAAGVGVRVAMSRSDYEAAFGSRVEPIFKSESVPGIAHPA